MVMASEEYQYTALPDPKTHIRLLVFDSDGAQRLETYLISEVPSYEAISYAWGTQNPTSSLTINGTRLAVTPHLLDGIKNLRLHATHFDHHQQRLWIDAVCINQKDDVEKAAQIPRMGAVYSNADRVLVWLGAAADESDRVLEEMGAMNRKLRAWGKGLREDQFVAAGLPPLSDSIWTFIARFWSRSWFGRLWIIQETLLAKRLLPVCGKICVSFEVLTGFVNACDHAGNIMSVVFREGPTDLVRRSVTALVYLGWARNKPLSEISALNLLIMGRTCDVTEPVDRVFGIFGLVQPHYRDAITVDYTPTGREKYWHVYISIARYHIGISGLAILSHAESGERPASMPSWVPNLNSRQPTEPYRDRQHFDAGLFSKWSNYRPAIDTTPFGWSCLRIRGTDVGTIIATSPLHYNFHIPRKADYTHQWKTIMEAYWLCNKMHSTGESDSIARSLALTLIADTSDEDFSRQYPGNALEDFEVYLRYLRAWMDGDTFLSEEQIARVTAYSRWIIWTWKHRCFFITGNGRIGLASQSSRPGDKVCVFLSAQTPFVLRPIENSDNFTLISDAYCHGVMHGEALKADGVELRDFVVE